MSFETLRDCVAEVAAFVYVVAMTEKLASGRDSDLRVGETLAPTLVFIAYGVVKFFTLGTSPAHWPDTYLAVAGAVASWVGVFLWEVTVWGKRTPGLIRSICVFSAFIPMLYSVYAITYLGVYGVYCSSINSFSILGILFGFVCIGLGYRMANGLAALTGRRGPPLR